MDPVLPVMDELLACLCAAVAASPGGATCQCSLLPGPIAIPDYCSCNSGSKCGGQAWIRLVDTFPSIKFPTQDTTTDRCGANLLATLELGVTRCAPSSDTRGKPPTAVDQTNAVITQLGDYEAMRCAVDACWPGRKRAVGRYQPTGQADCVGGTLTVVVRLGRVR